MSSLSVVIPVYNEEAIIKENLATLIEYLDGLHLDKYEVLICENGSTDSTPEIAANLAKENKNIRIISVKKRGYGSAIRNGILSAQLENVVAYPMDLCYDIKFIEKCLPLLERHDAVFGVRYMSDCKNERPFIRTFISQTHTSLINLIFGTKFNDVDCLKAYKTPIGKKVMALTRANDAFVEVEAAMIIRNSRIPYTEVAISHVEKKHARHPSYFFKIVAYGLLAIIPNYLRLTKISV